MNHTDAEEAKIRRIEWQNRLLQAQKFFRELSKDEQSIIQGKASRSAEERAGKRPDFSPGASMNLGRSQHDSLAQWAFQWDAAFVRECERLQEFKAGQRKIVTHAAASDEWGSNRE